MRGRFYSGRRAALTAAATAAAPGQDSARTLRRLHEPWQKRAFGYYDMLGECWNPAQFYARGMAKIRYFPAIKEQDGTLTEIEEGPEVDALKDIEHVAPEYGKLIFLIGEGRLCQSRLPDADPDSDVDWEFLSPTEIALAEDGRRILRGVDRIEYENISDAEAGEPEPGQMRMWRFWRKHPQNSLRADSPVRPVLDLYEQLWWLTMSERSDLQNRIADAGLMLIPEEIDFGPETPEDEAADDDPEVDPFTAYVGEMMMTAIKEPGSAAASVPGVIRAPAEYLHPDVFRMLHTHDPASSLFASQREEAIIRRIAMGLDLPVEEVMGLSKANHWTAWKVEDQKWQHLEPIATLFSDDVAAAYLRPLIRASNPGSDVSRLVVGYDNSAFARDPDRGATAITLHKEGMLGAEATLEANGWDIGESGMTPEEQEVWLAIQLRDASLVPGAEPPPEPEAPPPGAEGEQPQDEGRPDDPQQAARVADYAVRRAREVGGAALRSLRRSCPECFEGTDDVKPVGLLAALTEKRASEIPAFNRAHMETVMTAAFRSVLSQLGYDVDPDEAARFFRDTLFTVDGWPEEHLDLIVSTGG